MTDAVRLTEAEIDSLTECECGHFANEHGSMGCLANVDDPDEGIEQDDGTVMCACFHSPDAINRHAIEAILTTRLAARDAEWRAKVEALHRPWTVCDDCDHEHTDADVRDGRAIDTGYSYTCTDAALYIACVACCCDGDDDDPQQSEDCVTYHQHTLDPTDRCATVRLLRDMEADS